jgi:predicted small lipoprotein YifL
MRLLIVLLMALILPACGKTGALFLPEEAPAPVEQVTLEPPAETTSDENTD